MGIDYALIVGILLYVVIVRAFDSRNLSISFASIAVVAVPFIFSMIMRYIMLTSHHVPLSQLVTPADFIIVLVQLFVAFGVFYKLLQNEESIVGWALWTMMGCIGIYFVAPYAVRLFVS